MPKRFIATFDQHYGFQRRNGHKYPIHDEAAWGAVVEFAKDFKPHTWIHGGDLIDCASISHWNKGKPGQTEGMRLLRDAEEGRKIYLDPVEAIVGKGDLIYITGNHERFLTDLIDEMPSLEGFVDLDHLLHLNRWDVIPQGGGYALGKLYFVHGDQLKGGEHIAKAAVTTYERNIRFGHYHTAQTFTKTSPIDAKLGKTGVAVPCLCSKDVVYGKGQPNRWVQGFQWGYVHDDGMFSDYTSIITNGQFTALGRTYRG